MDGSGGRCFFKMFFLCEGDSLFLEIWRILVLLFFKLRIKGGGLSKEILSPQENHEGCGLFVDISWMYMLFIYQSINLFINLFLYLCICLSILSYIRGLYPPKSALENHFFFDILDHHKRCANSKTAHGWQRGMPTLCTTCMLPVVWVCRAQQAVPIPLQSMGFRSPFERKLSDP